MGSLLTLFVYLWGAVIIFFIGLLVYRFKAYDLIAGYNTMSAEEKSNYDIESTAKRMWIFSCILTPITILAGVLEYCMATGKYISLVYLIILFSAINILVISENKQRWTSKVTIFMILFNIFVVAIIVLSFFY